MSKTNSQTGVKKIDTTQTGRRQRLCIFKFMEWHDVNDAAEQYGITERSIRRKVKTLSAKDRKKWTKISLSKRSGYKILHVSDEFMQRYYGQKSRQVKTQTDTTLDTQRRETQINDRTEPKNNRTEIDLQTVEKMWERLLLEAEKRLNDQKDVNRRLEDEITRKDESHERELQRRDEQIRMFVLELQEQRTVFMTQIQELQIQLINREPKVIREYTSFEEPEQKPTLETILNKRTL